VLDFLPFVDPEKYEVDVACPPVSTLWQGLEGDDRARLHRITAARGPSLEDLASLGGLLPLAARADVIHAHSSKSGFLGRLAATLVGRADRCVFTPHAWSFWAAEGAAAQAYVRLERLAAHWCRAIMVVAEAEQAAGLAAGVGRTAQYRVVPNGVDLARFAQPAEPVRGRVLVVGRLARQKRPDLAVEVARLLRGRVEGFELHFVGDGPLRTETERLVTEAGVGDCVRFLGNRPDVPALLAGAACVLLTSDYEACPMTVLEALAAGVPVVATRVGGVPELVSEETGALAEAGDAAGLAAEVERLLRAPAEARALGENARRDARARFSRERTAARVLELYDEVASSTRRG
jgi:glycosyltransferase involved in cell wall biosynthesis